MPKKKPSKTVENQNWRSRIVGHEKVRADQLMANPFNHRRHPQKQRDVVEASIRELGFVKSVLVNTVTGHIVDGHERAMQALGRGDDTLVDVEYVELSEEEEKKALLILDASSELATIDAENLDALLRDVHTGEQALADLIAEMAIENGVVAPDTSTQEIDPNSFSLQCSCPKCGFEFDPK